MGVQMLQKHLEGCDPFGARLHITPFKSLKILRWN